MTKLFLTITGAGASVRKTGALTTGMVGAEVECAFDEQWDGLNRLAVFRCGEVVKDNALAGNKTQVPHEVLTQPGQMLYIGVEGRSKHGDLVIPTVWAEAGLVLAGASASGDPALAPTPSQFDRFMEEVEQVDEKITTALQQAKDSGEFDGTPVTHHWDGTVLTVTSASGSSSADLKGDKGDGGGVFTVNGIGPDEKGNVQIEVGSSGGEDGFSPIANVTKTDQGAVITITDKTGTTTATITNGRDGQNGKDGQPGAKGDQGETPKVFRTSYTASTSMIGTLYFIPRDSLTLAYSDVADDVAAGDLIIGADGRFYVAYNDAAVIDPTKPIPCTLVAVLKGAKGDTGATGSQGPKGDPGEKGDKGDPGDDYVLTAGDKTEIARQASQMVEIPEDLGKVFLVRETDTGIDKTNAEIYQAYLQGKPIYGISGSGEVSILHPVSISQQTAVFFHHVGEATILVTCGQNGVTQRTFVYASADDVDMKLDKASLPAAIDTALAQAKASGAFDGKDGQNGKDGSNGKDGVSATHSWNGTTLTITSASGTSSANLKGEKGDTGPAYTLTTADKSAIATQVKNALPTLTVTGVDADGVSHSWTMYGVAQ